jgi:hypothetical protein
MEFDDLVLLMKKFTESSYKELGEEEAAAPSGGAGAAGGGYPTVTKWESGLARSVANTLDSKVKWNSLYKITRGKGNTLI